MRVGSVERIGVKVRSGRRGGLIPERDGPRRTGGMVCLEPTGAVVPFTATSTGTTLAMLPAKFASGMHVVARLPSRELLHVGPASDGQTVARLPSIELPQHLIFGPC